MCVCVGCRLLVSILLRRGCRKVERRVETDEGGAEFDARVDESAASGGEAEGEACHYEEHGRGRIADFLMKRGGGQRVGQKCRKNGRTRVLITV